MQPYIVQYNGHMLMPRQCENNVLSSCMRRCVDPVAPALATCGPR